MSALDSSSVVKRDGGCCGCHQFVACMKKNILLKKRDRVGCLLELLLPIIFVIGTVLIWKAFGHSVNSANQFINYQNPGPLSSARVFDTISNGFCYEGSSAIGNLSSCSSVSFTYKCFPPDVSVPVTNLCYNSNSAVFNQGAIIGSLLGAVQTSMVRPIPIDDMVLMQWLARYTLSSRARRDYYTPVAALVHSGKLHFAPDTPAVASLIAYLNSTSAMFKHICGYTFPSIDAAENHVKSATTEGQNWGIIHALSLAPQNINVQIRLNATAMPITDTLTNKYYLGGSTTDDSLYILNGFYTLQTAISTYILERIANVTSNVDVPAPFVVPMGYAAYDTQDFLAFGGEIAPLILVLGFLYPVSQLAKRVVLEKELRVREAMMIMGLKNSAFYASWIVTYVIQNLFSSIIITIILKNTYVTRVDSGVLFFTFYFFQLSTISLSGLISSFFSKSRLAALITPLVYVALSMPLFAIQNGSSRMRRGLLVLSPTAFSNAMQLIFQHELGGGLGKADLRLDDPSMISILVALALDSVLYLLLWLYIDAVIPNDWGTPRHPLFCILEPFRWFVRNMCSSSSKSSGYSEDDEELKKIPDGRAVEGVFEFEQPSNRISVQVLGLRKEFDRGGKTFTAVNNLYWNIKEGEISVLLGHNGAGKSTTLNMMTGMMEPDGGDCFIYGHSVRSELDRVRQEIGYCPQHNVLWPELTSEEHLYFFASIKGLDGQEREDAVTRMLDAVDLSAKRFELASSLSGGQKRKLSVANAFVGGSRLIFLDEPTAGMDVGARRHTWDLLKRMSSNHTILLTTHFMDEADLLGHKIAIMNEGSLQCSGSSLFLKSRLGVGYTMVLSTEGHHVNHPTIQAAIKEFVPDAGLVSAGVGELCYRLPSASVPQFPALMAMLETRGQELGVRNFSVSATTLEEIFLQIAQGQLSGGQAQHASSRSPISGSSPRQILENFQQIDIKDASPAIVATPAPGQPTAPVAAANTTGVCLPSNEPSTEVRVPETPSSTIWNVRRIDPNSNSMFVSQLQCMLVKRFRNSLRDRRTQCLQIVCPVVCILLAMLFSLINLFNAPPITLTSNAYGVPVEVNLFNCSSAIDTTIPFSSLAVTAQPSGLSTAKDLSLYLMNNANAHGNIERYGAMACSDYALQVALGINDSTTPIVFYNYSTTHQLPISVFDYYNALYRKNYGQSAFMSFVNNPMPKTDREAAFTDNIKSILIGIIIMIPFTFVPSTYVSWVVKERECKARHLQNVSGLRFSVYWLSNFIFDMLSFVVTMCLALVVFAIFNRQEYIGHHAIGGTIVLFFFYGLAGVGFAYVSSFLFKEHSTAQNIVMLANFITGFLLVLLVFILGLVESTKSAANILAYIFRVIPSYCIGDGIINLALLQFRATFGDTSSVFSMNVVGWDIVYMAIEFPLMMIITLFIDHPTRRMRTQALLHNPDAPAEEIPNEDEDVKKERYEIEHTTQRASDLVVVRNLRKKYSNGKVAVKNLSFGVHPGEVFGFLGTNGAGKTTTISILCQEFYPSSGHAYVAGNDIVLEANAALRCIGYCPQFDALLDLLTVEEHLYLYAGVRGIAQEDRQSSVEHLASLCELTEYMKTVASELSGGNKRKLSVALSLLGGPNVVFLDEPSAGMDPVARRGLWTAISSVADNCSVVLCTHHLEEVEALAHRVAIMVDGTLRCVGDKLHLKTKFGSGYEMSLRLQTESLVPAFEEFLLREIPEARLEESRSLRFTYALPQDVRLSSVFQRIENNKARFGITDYSISQTSIEQVFLRISAEAASSAEAE